MNKKRSNDWGTPGEYDAAVNGTLEPRKIKGTKEQKALTSTDRLGRPNGRPIGVKTGLQILGAWCYVFQENEKRPAGKKWTDAQISELMKEDFPRPRHAQDFGRPNVCRNDYNRGKFTNGKIPKVRSNRWD